MAEGSHHVAFHSSNAEASALGNLLVRESMDAVGDEYLPGLRREAQHRLLDAVQ
jgi:hypothetical protein